MSNPLRAPVVQAVASEAAPDAYFESSPEFDKRRALGKSIPLLQEFLDGLDMEMAPTIIIPAALTLDPSARASAKPFYAQAKGGKPQFRCRSGPARKAVSAIWAHLPDSEDFFSRGRVRAKMEDTFYVDAGAEYALGRLRKAYPKVGSYISHPVTRAEAQRALDNSGVRIDHLMPHAVRPYPLIAAPDSADERVVSVNPKSDNGFPVLVQWSSDGAAEMCMRMAVTIRRELVEAVKTFEGVEGWKRRAEAERPWVVAVRGKAKGDYYCAEKVRSSMLRFYNALPRQVVLNMQVATQPLEAVSRSVLEGSCSGIGLSLTRRGADHLVAELDARLARDGYAYVHVGDDSWVVVRAGNRLVWFALDCSNFDLTQHADATLEVHRAVRDQLRLVDSPAADLWYAYARERLVVVAGTLVRRLKHGGPSGMPLQSKVNDMLMDVLIQRVLRSRPDWLEEQSVDACIAQVGQQLGFTVRVEQYGSQCVTTVRGALEVQPFLFIGYYFHVREGVVHVCSDVPRTMSQLPYPGLKWMASDKEMAVMEAMRLGSCYLSAGSPPAALEPAFAAWRLEAENQLSSVIARFGDQTDERLRWAVSESPWGPSTEPSLSGLLAAVRRPLSQLWLEEEQELPSESVLVGLDWAEQVEAEEAEEVRMGRVYVPPPPLAPLPRALPLPGRPVPTHPVTRRNDGRTPPSAVWHPPRLPRVYEVRAALGIRRRGRVLPEEEEEWWTDSHASDEYAEEYE